MKLGDFLSLIRFKNLIIVAYMLSIIHYILLPFFNISTQLNNLQFWCFTCAILFITAAGYIINDIFDIDADLINNPSKVIVSKKITIERAQLLYKNMNSIGIILGVIISINIQKPTFAFIFIGTSILLYWYSKYFKKIALIGNFLVSLLSAITIPLLILFDLLNFKIDVPIFILSLLTLFAFLLTFTRELIKDIEDVNGDKAFNMNTLPVLIGRKRTKLVAVVFIIITLSLLMFLSLNYAEIYKYTILYILVTVFFPLLIIVIKLISLKNYNHIYNYSLALKIIMFLGINSLLIIALF